MHSLIAVFVVLLTSYWINGCRFKAGGDICAVWDILSQSELESGKGNQTQDELHDDGGSEIANLQ